MNDGAGLEIEIGEGLAAIVELFTQRRIIAKGVPDHDALRVSAVRLNCIGTFARVKQAGIAVPSRAQSEDLIRISAELRAIAPSLVVTAYPLLAHDTEESLFFARSRSTPDAVPTWFAKPVHKVSDVDQTALLFTKVVATGLRNGTWICFPGQLHDFLHLDGPRHQRNAHGCGRQATARNGARCIGNQCNQHKSCDRHQRHPSHGRNAGTYAGRCTDERQSQEHPATSPQSEGHAFR